MCLSHHLYLFVQNSFFVEMRVEKDNVPLAVFYLIPLLYLILLYGFVGGLLLEGYSPKHGNDLIIPSNLNWLYVICSSLFIITIVAGIMIIGSYIIFRLVVKRFDNGWYLNLGLISTVGFFIDAYYDYFTIYDWLFDY